MWPLFERYVAELDARHGPLVMATVVCIYSRSIYINWSVMGVDRIAKLFVNGGSQAVRLPAEFRFEGVKEVYVRRNAVTGEVILSPKPGSDAWSDFFKLRDRAGVPDDFMSEQRPGNEVMRSATWQKES
jgi:antitoxin VapB